MLNRPVNLTNTKLIDNEAGPSPASSAGKKVPPEATTRPPTGPADCVSSQIAQTTLDQVGFGRVPAQPTPTKLRTIRPISLQLETRGITSHRPDTPRSQSQTGRNQEFWRTATIHKFALAAKLRQIGQADRAAKLEDCHSHYTFAKCNDCGSEFKFPNRCDQFYCPECQPSLSHKRRQQVEWWTREIRQPKHVVLTVANTPTLTGQHVDELRQMFGRLRRRRFCDNWRGGFYTVEVTNEGNGWHLHLHILTDAQWIDAGQLAKEWQAASNGLGRIVQVKDCRDKTYLAEVTKYAVKGNQLAAWSAETSLEFILAFEGKRTFGVFGALFGKRTEFKEWIDAIRDAKPKCDCGSCNVSYYSESQWLMRDLQPNQSTRPPPDPRENAQLELCVRTFDWPD